jgi:predicted outer membrane lipoprotein
MTLILGMDPIVFIAWIGTILAAIFCVIYGIYYEFIKKSKEDKDTISEEIIKNNKVMK